MQSPLDSDIQPCAQGGFADYCVYAVMTLYFTWWLAVLAEGAFALPTPDGLPSSVAAPHLCDGGELVSVSRVHHWYHRVAFTV